MVEHIPSSVRCYRLIKSQLERAPSCTVQCILYVLCAHVGVQVCARGYIGGIISAGGPALPAFQREIIVGRVPDADDDYLMMHMEIDGFLSVSQ